MESRQSEVKLAESVHVVVCQDFLIISTVFIIGTSQSMLYSVLQYD